MNYTADEKLFIDFYDKMGDGKIPYNPKFYQVEDYVQSTDKQKGSADPNITLVSPTEAQVDQAKQQLKRKLLATPKAIKRRKIHKTKRSNKVKKKQVKRKKAKRNQKKRQIKTKVKKKTKAKRKQKKGRRKHRNKY